MKKILSFLGSLFGFILGYLLGLFLGNKEKNELQTYIEQKNSCETKFNQEKKDLEEEKKKLNNLSLMLDSKNKGLEEKQKDIVNKEKDLKQREQNLQSEEQDLTTRRSYITSQEQSLMQRENEITQREGELNNKLSSGTNEKGVFFFVKKVSYLTLELPMDWIEDHRRPFVYSIGNEIKTNLHSFLKCASPKSEDSEYDSIVNEEYIQKIKSIIPSYVYYYDIPEYYSFEISFANINDGVFTEIPFLFMFFKASRYRLMFFDNLKMIKCYLKYCLDPVLGQEETSPKFGYKEMSLIFSDEQKYYDFKNLLKNDTFKDEYKNIIFT